MMNRRLSQRRPGLTRYIAGASALGWLLLATSALAKPLEMWIEENCASCLDRMADETGGYILEKGEESLIGRAWLTAHAQQSIDVQYFIWSSDNIGTLAAEGLLRAAERGVRVRVIVDDITIDAGEDTLLLLAAHDNVHIRIYNPTLTVGASFFDKLVNVVTRFRSVNQRMHDKTAIFDGIAGITGGRNMADEYFDFDPAYNFRDRDILLLGTAVTQMQDNFDEFWDSPLSVPVEELLNDEALAISAEDARQKSAELRLYAENPENFSPTVRDAIERMPDAFPRLLTSIEWGNAVFISDTPGKNDGAFGLAGGGQTTRTLADAVRGARHSVLIQSPYLVMPPGGFELFRNLNEKGVRVRISTNSLASTDNIPAFSGYHRQRPRLLDAGIELYEYRPHPEIKETLIERYPELARLNPVFALHAKSMVIDDRLVYIGTFNLDPRSANLNTEVGVLIDSPQLARQLTESIESDMAPGNSWQTTAEFAPDYGVGRSKRLQLGFVNLLPIEPLL